MELIGGWFEISGVVGGGRSSFLCASTGATAGAGDELVVLAALEPVFTADDAEEAGSGSLLSDGSDSVGKPYDSVRPNAELSEGNGFEKYEQEDETVHRLSRTARNKVEKKGALFVFIKNSKIILTKIVYSGTIGAERAIPNGLCPELQFT